VRTSGAYAPPPKSEAILRGEGVGYSVARLDASNITARVKEELIRRMQEKIKERDVCPGNPESDFLTKPNMEGMLDIHYIARDPDFGVIGYCNIEMGDDIYYNVPDPSKPSEYDYTAKVATVPASCSFTLSPEIKDGIAGKIKGGAPNVGRYIKEEIGRQICEEYEVDKVIFISDALPKALPNHKKNGAKVFSEIGLGVLDNLRSVVGSSIYQRMIEVQFFSAATGTNTEVVRTQISNPNRIYVEYPPIAGGGRRRRRGRGQKSKKRRGSYRRRVRGTRRRR
jgi:hypothetical protein